MVEVKVGYYSMFMCSPPKISWTICGGEQNICLPFLTVVFLTQPINKETNCFNFNE